MLISVYREAQILYILCIYVDPDLFEWDEHNLKKIRRHRVSAEEVMEALTGRPMYQYPQLVEGERRELYYGETARGRLIAVAVTIRGEQMRVITAYDLGAEQKRRYLRYRLEQDDTGPEI